MFFKHVDIAFRILFLDRMRVSRLNFEIRRTRIESGYKLERNTFCDKFEISSTVLYRLIFSPDFSIVLRVFR